MKVYEIPEGEKQSKGRAIQNLIQIPPDDKVRAIIGCKETETIKNLCKVIILFSAPKKALSKKHRWKILAVRAQTA